MNRISFIAFVVCAVCINGLMPVFATENSEFEDQALDLLNSEQYKEATQLDDMLSFESFNSCDDMHSVLTDFLKENEKYFMQYGGYYPVSYGTQAEMVFDAVEETAMNDQAALAPVAAGNADKKDVATTISSDGTAVSTTNVQVKGIDEPDILKTDGDYLYYYSVKNKKVYILQSPLDRSSATIDLNDASVISTIKVPKGFENIQLFLQNNRLIILGQRWRQVDYNKQTLVDASSRIDVVVYDVRDVHDPKLERFTDLDGSYTDARMIGDELYVITNLGVNWGYAYKMMEDGEEIGITDILPKGIDVAYKKEGDDMLTIKGNEYPYGINVERSDCDDVLYVLPSSESLEKSGMMPSFTVVRKIDISSPKSDVETTTAFGSTETVHMSHDSLYLANPLWLNNNSRCPENARCIMPWFGGGDTHTLLHKFAVESDGLDYEDSTLIPGSPLTQWSMSEDDRGYFRIVTQTRFPNLNTHLFVLDPNLDVSGMVRNIQDNEEFKASRFMGNKLYLVTFERTDPLFVIDIADPNDPEIVGELKIPGYSTYLHPYAQAKNGVQYLIGIGYDTKENQRGGVTNAGVKVDLYEIDYTTRNEDDMIAVSQKFTETLGDRGSWSEAVENPRMFVWNEKTKSLIIPIILQNQEAQQQCTVQYDSDGKEVSRDCWENYNETTDFAGMKVLSIDAAGGIKESASYDYKDSLAVNNDYGDYDDVRPVAGESEKKRIGSWQFRQLMFRVGYLGDVLYALNNDFAHFVVPSADDQETMVTLQ